MANELYQRLDELVEENKELTIKLGLADSEVANLRIEVKRLEDGHLELSVKLEDANSEIGRLGMRLKHRYDDLAAIRRHHKFGKITRSGRTVYYYATRKLPANVHMRG